MYQPLVACDACRRHVRASDALCPFCRHSRTPDTSLEVSPVLRMSRAAAFALIAGLGGCHTEPTAITPDPVRKTPVDAGTSVVVDAASEADVGLVDDPGGPAAEYGAPPLPKPPKPGPIAVPAYGAPPKPPAPKPTSTTMPPEF